MIGDERLVNFRVFLKVVGSNIQVNNKLSSLLNLREPLGSGGRLIAMDIPEHLVMHQENGLKLFSYITQIPETLSAGRIMFDISYRPGCENLINIIIYNSEMLNGILTQALGMQSEEEVEIPSQNSIDTERTNVERDFIEILTNPPGATVVFDGQNVGPSPVRIANPLPGEKVVACGMDGYEPVYTTIRYNGGAVTNELNLTQINPNLTQSSPEPTPEPTPEPEQIVKEEVNNILNHDSECAMFKRILNAEPAFSTNIKDFVPEELNGEGLSSYISEYLKQRSCVRPSDGKSFLDTVTYRENAMSSLENLLSKRDMIDSKIESLKKTIDDIESSNQLTLYSENINSFIEAAKTCSFVENIMFKQETIDIIFKDVIAVCDRDDCHVLFPNGEEHFHNLGDILISVPLTVFKSYHIAVTGYGHETLGFGKIKIVNLTKRYLYSDDGDTCVFIEAPHSRSIYTNCDDKEDVKFDTCLGSYRSEFIDACTNHDYRALLFILIEMIIRPGVRDTYGQSIRRYPLHLESEQPR